MPRHWPAVWVRLSASPSHASNNTPTHPKNQRVYGIIISVEHCVGVCVDQMVADGNGGGAGVTLRVAHSRPLTLLPRSFIEQGYDYENDMKVYTDGFEMVCGVVNAAVASKGFDDVVDPVGAFAAGMNYLI